MSDFVEQGQEDAEAERLARLDALGQMVAKKRDEAVQFRKQSGIEDVWTYCEESYLGIDDANRAEWQGAKWAKPAALNGPLTRETRSSNASQSTVFIPLTARYVDAGAAKLSEIILPLDGKPFSLSATPNPELITKLEQAGQPLTDDAGQPLGQDFVLMNHPTMPLGTVKLFRDAVYYSIERSASSRRQPKTLPQASKKMLTRRRRRPRSAFMTGWSRRTTRPRCARFCMTHPESASAF